MASTFDSLELLADVATAGFSAEPSSSRGHLYNIRSPRKITKKSPFEYKDSVPTKSKAISKFNSPRKNVRFNGMSPKKSTYKKSLFTLTSVAGPSKKSSAVEHLKQTKTFKSERLTFDEVISLNNKTLLEKFSEIVYDEIKGVHIFKCFLLPNTCMQIYKCTKNEAKARSKMKHHLLKHLDRLSGTVSHTTTFKTVPQHIKNMSHDKILSKQIRRSNPNKPKLHLGAAILQSINQSTSNPNRNKTTQKSGHSEQASLTLDFYDSSSNEAVVPSTSQGECSKHSQTNSWNDFENNSMEHKRSPAPSTSRGIIEIQISNPVPERPGPGDSPDHGGGPVNWNPEILMASPDRLIEQSLSTPYFDESVTDEYMAVLHDHNYTAIGNRNGNGRDKAPFGAIASCSHAIHNGIEHELGNLKCGEVFTHCEPEEENLPDFFKYHRGSEDDPDNEIGVKCSKEDLETDCPSTLTSVEKTLALKFIHALRTKKKRSLPFWCQICKNKKFTTQATLMYHYRSHAGVKPYRCMVCDSTFTRQHSLNYHTQMHQEVQCQYCDKQFRNSSLFKSHLQMHEITFEEIECIDLTSSSSELDDD